MKYRLALLSLPLLGALNLHALENVYMTFKYGLSDLDNSVKLDKHTFGVDFTADTGNNLKPKFDFSYVNVAEGSGGVDYTLQFSANALYEVSQIYLDTIVPYAYGGIGYEYVHNERAGFESAPYVQIAGGLEFPFFGYSNDDFKLLTEVRWMQLITNNSGQDSEASIFFGFRISTGTFGGYSHEDSYRDYTSQNSSEYPELSQPDTSAKFASSPVSRHIVFSDTDGDSVSDEKDRCPHTPKGTVVDVHGCSIMHRAPIKLKSVHERPAQTVQKKPTFHALPSQRETLAVMFEPDSATIRDATKAKVRQLVERLNERGYRFITIEGYTDNSGLHEANIALSQKRADAVKKLMIQYGIDAHKIKATGKGELNPVADNDTPEGRAQNRRIEIVIE